MLPLEAFLPLSRADWANQRPARQLNDVSKAVQAKARSRTQHTYDWPMTDRLTDEEFDGMRALIKRFAESELDQWALWRTTTKFRAHLHLDPTHS